MRVIKVLSALCVVILVMGGCDNWVRIPPTLHSPNDGAVFLDEAPTFEWGSEVKATEYTIRICRDSFPYGDVLIEDTLQNTTYTMPQDVFDEADTGTYTWVVACLWEDEEPCWSKSRTFQIEKQIEESVSQLLYNTYFPMDTSYEWVYRREIYYWDGENAWFGGVYDVIVKVDSMTELDNGWVIYHLNSYFFCDVGKNVTTDGHEIIIFKGTDTIPTDSYQSPSYAEIQRTKGFGLVYQVQGYYETHVDRLQYFRKGNTIWRYE